VLGQPETVKLALWHGLNLPLLLSILTMTIGVALYFGHLRVRAALANLMDRLPITGNDAYERIKGGILWLAKVQTAVLQGGSLRRYLFFVFAATTGGVGTTLIIGDAVRWPAEWPVIPVYEWGVVLFVAAGAVLPILVRSRLAAIGGLGVVGSGVALIFLFYGAPDVAITQLLVEVLFLVIMAVILLKLPRFVGQGHPGRGGRTRDLVLAAAGGLVMTLLLLAVLDSAMSVHLTRFFEAASVPDAHGRNIVNVILVDFRALDTLGEIIVVAVASLGAFALIKLRAGRGRSS